MAPHADSAGDAIQLHQVKDGEAVSLQQWGEKTCLSCRESWPADEEFFRPDNASEDRLSTCCIACIKEGKRAFLSAREKMRRAMRYEPRQPEKRCMTCGESWPANLKFFGAAKLTRDKLTPRCAACIKERCWARPAKLPEDGLMAA
jgi:hypothetical protein